jgi:2-methylcitrate dehydratase PrpD
VATPYLQPLKILIFDNQTIAQTAISRKLTLDPFNDLGRVYDLVEQGLKIKCYPCGGRSHTSIDAALALRDGLSKRLSDISSIKVGITKVNAKRLGNQYPSTVESAKFSIPYLIAYALVHGAPLISAFTEEALRDERVKAVAKTVSLNIDPEFADVTVDHPTRVKVALSDGQTMEQMRYYSCGTPEVPMSQAQIQEKFLDCSSRAVSANLAKRIFALLNTLRDQPSFKEFWPLLRRS